MVVVLLLATGLRLYRLDAQSFWNDEGNTARAAERRIPLILEAAEGDIHPPGYYLLLHFWRALAGESEFALRALSALCGVLTVALTYGLGRRLLGTSTGLGAACLAALSPLGVYYSQEARMYALLGLLSVLSTYLLCDKRYAMSEKRASCMACGCSSLAYVVTTAAGLYTHYAFPFILLSHNLLFLAWWGVRVRRPTGRWRFLLGWFVAQVAVLALFLPWLPAALKSVTGWSPAGRGHALGPALLDVLRALTVGITLEMEEALWALLAAGGLLLAGLWPVLSAARPRRRQVGAVGMLAAWLFLPIGLIFAFDLYKPAYLKFLLAVLPPFHLLLAHGVERLSPLASRLLPFASRFAHHVLRSGFYVFLLATAFLPSLHNLYFNPAYARDDYRQIAADIRAMARPGDGIILNAPNQWEVFTYYYRQGVPVYPIPRARPPRADAVAAELERIAADHARRRLFAIYWGEVEADPARLVESWLAAHAYKTGDRWYGRVRVAVYGLESLPEEPAVPLDVHFGETIRLQGYAVGEGPFAPGDVVPVTLFWEANAVLSERYKVFLHLLDAGGSLVAQTDAEPLGNLMPTTVWVPGKVLTDRHGVLLPQDLPAGDYALVAGLYHLITAERMPVVVGEGPSGDHLSLGSVTVLSDPSAP